MNNILIDKDKLLKYTEIVEEHRDIIFENNSLQMAEALQRCLGNLHYCVQTARKMEVKIYN